MTFINDKKYKIFYAACSIVIIIAILLFFRISKFINYRTDDSTVFEVSKSFVIKQLASPSTVTFCSLQDAKIMDIGGEKFSVSGCVDSYNTYGEKVRNSYTCTIKKNIGNTWSIESMSIFPVDAES